MNATAALGPVTDGDLETLFGSKTIRQANLGLSRLHQLLDGDAAHDLLPRVAEMLWRDGVLESHRRVYDALCHFVVRGSDDESIGVSSFTRHDVHEGPAKVARRMLADQQGLLQILERWGHRSRNSRHLADEGYGNYRLFSERFFGSCFGSAELDQHKPSEQWMADQWEAARSMQSRLEQDAGRSGVVDV